MSTVLLVDNEQRLLDFTKIYLERNHDLHVDTSLSALDAMDKLTNNHYDAIVSDYMMPGMNGIEFLKNVRHSFGDIPFILFTGKGREEVVIEALNNGADFYLQKGGDPKSQFAELMHKITLAIDRRMSSVALKNSEQKILTAEGRYRTLIEKTNEAVLVIQDGRICYGNPKVEQLGHYSIEELSQKPFIEFVHPDDRSFVEEQYIRRLSGEVLKESYTFRIISKEGSVFWMVISSGLISWDERPALLVLLLDITDRILIEDTLQKSEEAFWTIFDSIHDAIHIHEIETGGKSGKFIRLNRFVCDMLGYPADELMNSGPLDITTDYYSRPLHEIIGECIKRGHTIFETEYLKKDGSVLPVEIDAHMVNIRGKQFMVSVVRDISSRKMSEQNMSQYDEHFRTIIHALQFGIIIIDAKSHKILDANKKALEMFGADSNQVYGQVCHKHICPAEWGKCPVTDLGQTIDSSERILLTEQGQERPILKSVIRTVLGGNDVLIESFIDITDRKLAEKALFQANQKLNLLSGITRHDISNQLTALTGYLQLIENDSNDLLRHEHLEKILTAAKRISTMIRYTKEYEDIGVRAPVWHDCRALVDTAIKETNVAYVEILNHIPEGVEVFADPLIIKVFYNLIDNAIRHGKSASKIRFSGAKNEGLYIIACEDDGVGIPAEDKKKIFEHGFGMNSGLGLALSCEILNITGITLSEAGEPGNGARFEIAVPLEVYRSTVNTKREQINSDFYPL